MHGTLLCLGQKTCYHVFCFEDFLVSFFEILYLIHLDCRVMLLNLLIRLIRSMTSIICLLFLFVVSIISENAFVCLHLVLVLPSGFVVVINVAWGGTNT